MATKDHYCHSFKANNQQSNLSNQNDQYKSLNLNEKRKYSILETVQSKSISTSNFSSTQQKDNYACTNASDTVQSKNHSSSWNQNSSDNFNSNGSYIFDSFENSKKSKSDNSNSKKSSSSNNSTLSLHITAYENSIEAQNELNSSVAKNDGTNLSKIKINKFLEVLKSGFASTNENYKKLAPLSKALTGVILPYETYGSHLNSSHKTVDANLELKNFTAAGQTLGEIWSELSIADYPVKAEFICPDSEKPDLNERSEKWIQDHVLQTQYCLQISKCQNKRCCDEPKTSVFSILKDRFLPPPVPFSFNTTEKSTIDTLTYIDLNGNIIYLDENSSIPFEPYQNGTERNVTIKFESDGKDFMIVIYRTSCACNGTVWLVSCEFYSMFTITNTSIYCANMNCNFSIETEEECTGKLILFSMATYDNNLIDSFKLISNNRTSFKAFSGMDVEFIILNSSITNIFEVITYRSLTGKTFSATAHTIDKPENQLSHTLSKEKPYFAKNIALFDKYSIITVNVSSEVANPVIEICSDYRYDTELFNYVAYYRDESYTEYIGNECFSGSLFCCKIHGNQVVAVIMDDTANTLYHAMPLLLFQLPRENRKGCIFEENVFFVPEYFSAFRNITHSAIANEHDSCTIFLITQSYHLPFPWLAYYYISSMWTTASNENVKMYLGTEKRRFILEFNSTTAPQFQNIYLFSSYYMFEIPKNSSLLINIIGLPINYIEGDSIGNQNMNLLSFPFSSVITTPLNGESRKIVDAFQSQHYQLNCYVDIFIDDQQSVEFTVFQYDVSKIFNFSVFADNVLQKLSNVGESVILTNTNVSICYNPTIDFSKIPLDDYSGVILYFKVLN